MEHQEKIKHYKKKSFYTDVDDMLSIPSEYSNDQSISVDELDTELYINTLKSSGTYNRLCSADQLQERPESTFSNLSDLSIESIPNSQDLQTIASQLNRHSQSKFRLNALNILLAAQVSDLINSEVWSVLSEQITKCLSDKDVLIFQTTSKLISNFISSQEGILEGFLSLLEGCLQLSHKKPSPHYKNVNSLHEAIPYYSTPVSTFSEYHVSQSSFTSILNGVHLDNPHHRRLVQISRLILRAQKECTKYWLRWPEVYITEMLENYVDFITIHIELSKNHRDKINVLHVLALLDPEAIWIHYWTHGVYISRRLIRIIKKSTLFTRFFVHTIIEYIAFTPKVTKNDENFKNTISENQIRLCLFLHCLNTMGQLLFFKKVHGIFPISIKADTCISLEQFLILLIRYLNNDKHYTDIVYTFWYKPTAKAISRIVCSILNRHRSLLTLKLVNTLVEPLRQKELNMMPKRNVYCLNILRQIVNVEANKEILFKKPTLSDNCEDELSEFIPSANGKLIKKQIHNNKSVSECSEVPEKTERTKSATLIAVIFSFSNKLFKQYNSIQELGNSATYIDVLAIFSSIITYYNIKLLITKIDIIPAILECYKYFFKQSNLTNDCSTSSMLNSLDCFFMQLGCTGIGLHKMQIQKGVLKIVLKRLINKPKFSCSDVNFRLLLSHVSNCKETGQAFENRSLLTDTLQSLWKYLEDTQSICFGSFPDDLHEKVTQLLDIVLCMSFNLRVVQSCINNETNNLGSDITLVQCDKEFPASLFELLLHVCPTPMGASEETRVSEKPNGSADSDHSEEQYTCLCENALGEHSVCMVALMVLRALITNLDISVFLNVRFQFKDNLLQGQLRNLISEPTIDSICEEKEVDSTLTKLDAPTKVIVDNLSLLRHQILVNSNYIGGPDETAPKIYDLEMYLDKHSRIPRIFTDWPLVNSLRKQPRTANFVRRNYLEEFLRKSLKAGPMNHDASWVQQAQEKLKQSEDIKNTVVVDLLAAVPKVECPEIKFLELAAKNEFESVVLFPEDYEGIELIVRYGLDIYALKDGSYHAKNLTTVLQMCYKSLLKTPRSYFQGFDWFVGVIFIACKGNVKRCRTFLESIIRMPCAAYFWSTFNEAIATQTGLGFGADLMPAKVALASAMEYILEDLGMERHILKHNGISWTVLAQSWINQCFLNVLNWTEIIRFLCACILYPVDFVVYFSITLLKHVMPILIKYTERSNMLEHIKLAHLDNFALEDYFSEIEEMRVKYQDVLIPMLQPTL